MSSSSLIISTYNWPRALSFCLQSVLQQVQLPSEVLVADDGSGEETRELIQRFQKIFPVPLIHVWHEDVGFRLAKIRNRAIAMAKGAYIVQVDGDVILHTHFIHDHLRISKENYFVIGSRGSLNKVISEKILQSRLLPGYMTLRKNATGKLNTFRNLFLSKFLSDKYKVSGKHKFYAKGCNMAYWRADAVAVNGYNELMVGWGREDEEFITRMFNIGLKKQFLKMGGVVFHIWHKRAAHQNEEANLVILHDTREQLVKKCSLGLDQYLADADTHNPL